MHADTPQMKLKTPEDFLRCLNVACAEFNSAFAEDICDGLIAYVYSSIRPFPLDVAKDILKIIRKRRYFSMMSRIADAFLRAGLDDAQIKRQYAQALIDQGMAFPALVILREIQGSQRRNSQEWAEARGLIGRAYKQIYIDAHDAHPPHNRRALLEAIASYFDVYKVDPEKYLWHGVNSISLIRRARTDGVKSTGLPDATKIAQAVIARVKELERIDKIEAYDLASAAEAYVAINNIKKAGEYLTRYVDRNDIDAFELESTRRQFDEVLRCGKNKMKASLLEILNSGILAKSGGTVSMVDRHAHIAATKHDKNTHSFERILGIEYPMSYDSYVTGLHRALCVGCVCIRTMHNAIVHYENTTRVGTGFIFPGKLLTDAWTGYQVFMTNNHVITTNRKYAPDALLDSEVEIRFDVLFGGHNKSPQFKVKKVLWESIQSELDVTCLLLDNEVSIPQDFPVAPVMPHKKFADGIYVIGHPLGGQLSFSIQDNFLIDATDNRLHYRSPTEPGNSGSPLFNKKWELIGIHHAGGFEMQKLHGKGKYPANEGIPISAIKKALTGRLG